MTDDLSDLITLAGSLAESAQLANRTEYESEASRAPGGEYVRPHIYDGPYHLVTLTSVDGDADFKALAVLEAFPPIEINANQYDELEPMLLVAVPKYGKRVLEWYADGETSYSVSEIELDPYDAPPTDRDLAAALPDLLGHDDADLRDTFVAVFDTVGIAPLLTLVRSLDADIVADGAKLSAAVRGVLTAPTS